METSRYNIVLSPVSEGRALLFNTLTCVRIEVPVRGLDLLKLPPENVDTLAGDDRRIVERFRKGGFLIEPGVDEEAILKHRYYRFKYNTRVMNLTIAPTLGCNLACPYCFESAALHPGTAPVMSADTCCALCRFVERNARFLRNLHVTWFGGEPLLVPDTIEELSRELIRVATAHDIRYTANIVTNGVLLDARADMVQRLRDWRVENVQVTLDGPAEVHNRRRALRGTGKGTFDRILDNVGVLEDAGIATTLRINVDKENEATIESLLLVLVERGLKTPSLYAAPINADTPGCTSMSGHCLTNRRFLARKRALRAKAMSLGLNAMSERPDNLVMCCGAGMAKTFVIDPDGDLYKCWQEIGVKSTRIGTLRQPDAKQGRMEEMRKIRWLTWDPFANPECRACPVLPVCLGRMCPYECVHAGAQKPDCCEWKDNLDGLADFA